MPKSASRNEDRRRRVRRVVLTGGPAAGKTAVAEVLRRQLGDEVAVLPEAATILFRGGFPRPKSPEARRHVQHAIFAVQRQLEHVFELTQPDLLHICDRGTLDGAAYWPGGPKRFLAAMGTTQEDELARYDAVIFLQTSAWSKDAYPDEETSIRQETPAEARKLDTKLRAVWGAHPNFFVVEHSARFYEKVAAVLITIHRIAGVGPDDPASRRRAIPEPSRETPS